MSDAGFLVVMGGVLFLVGQWFVSVGPEDEDDDDFSRGLLAVWRPLRLVGVAIALLGCVSAIWTMLF